MIMIKIQIVKMDSKFIETAIYVEEGRPVQEPDQLYPLPLDIAYARHIIGICASSTSFQICMSDGSRSCFDCSNPMFKTDFKEKLIPENSVIAEVEIMFHKT